MAFSFIIPPALQSLSARDLASWAVGAGFAAVDAEADMTVQTARVIRSSGLALGPMRVRASLADSDPSSRKAAVDVACETIDHAAALGVDTVWLLPRNFRNDSSQRENFAAAAASLVDLASHAENRDVRIALENCPFQGQNPICTPEAWDALFDRVGSGAVGICLDPSHCAWQGIDHLRVMREYRSRIVHLQAKDTEMLAEGRFRYGVEGPQLADLGDEDGWPQQGWWRHRLPGLGMIDWSAFFTARSDLGLTGLVTIEHEDPLGGGSPERVQRGLMQARDFLDRLVP